eukprot:COSAG01_NODE_5582_length_4168_cov_2.695257_2_plen_119_part_00
MSRPFPSWDRSILAEIYLCHACSCQEILSTETAGQVTRPRVAPPPAAAAATAAASTDADVDGVRPVLHAVQRQWQPDRAHLAGALPAAHGYSGGLLDLQAQPECHLRGISVATEKLLG